MNLCIDIGNSFCKWAMVREGLPGERGIAPTKECGKALSEFIRLHPHEIKKIGYINVSQEAAERAILESAGKIPAEKISAASKLPFRLLYENPQALGADRIAAAAGAFAASGKGPLLVFDAGTALTWDFVNEANEYEGGGISPGLKMRIQALHTFTARLPEIAIPKLRPALSGKSTESSLASGAFNGIIAEIQGIAENYRKQAGEGLSVFLTGGDGPVLGNHIKNLNFADPDLLFKGIDFILRLNHPDV